MGLSPMQASHPVLQPSEALRAFLEASEEDFALEVSRAAHEAAGGGAKKKLASTLQLFRDLGTSTANLMSGRSPDEEEDPEYLKVMMPPPCSMLVTTSAMRRQSLCKAEGGKHSAPGPALPLSNQQC